MREGADQRGRNCSSPGGWFTLSRFGTVNLHKNGSARLFRDNSIAGATEVHARCQVVSVAYITSQRTATGGLI